MRVSIRYKLIVAISTLVVMLFSIASYLFISEKRQELADDIYNNAVAFAHLTSHDVANKYDLYLAQNGFVYFNREMQALFEQNADIAAIKLLSYSGSLLYDSIRDVDQRFEGESNVNDPVLMAEIQSEYLSVLTEEGRLVFVNDGKFFDKNEGEVEPLAPGTRIVRIVLPGSEKYSIVYEIDYSNLELRVDRITKRIIYLALFGILMGLFMSLFMSGQITKPVAALVESTGRIAKGDFKARVEIKTHDEIRFLGDSFNQMAQDLEVSLEARVYKERVGRELELAKQIQKQLVPAKIPQIAGLEIAAGLEPAGEVGGDIYDFLTLENGRMLMYLGDVTGHGVPAGIVSSIANALFFAYANAGDLKQILVTVNRVLQAKTMPTMFMTLCLMDWDAGTGKFHFSNAGHEQIIHYKAAEKQAVLLESKGMALGMVPDISALTVVNEVPLAKDDFLLVYSDGIPEAWKNEKEKYGMDRLLKVVSGLGSMNAESVKQAILADVKQFANGYQQVDDITLIVIKKL